MNSMDAKEFEIQAQKALDEKNIDSEKKAAVDNHIENDYIKVIHPNKASRLRYYFQGAFDAILQDEIPQYKRILQWNSPDTSNLKSKIVTKVEEVIIHEK